MKIEKNVKLVEAADDELVLNTATDSKEDIADAVAQGLDVDDATAEEVAQEIEDASDAADANTVVIAPEPEEEDEYITKNRITDALDKSLKASRKFMRRGDKVDANILITGLPGSGKTAIVEDWCRRNGLVIVPMNAADSKIDAAVNGMPLRDQSTEEEANKIVYVYSMEKLGKLLDPKNAGKCILFVDEYNRQTDLKLRRTFMSMFNEKRNADGSLDFSKNLLFTVVAINPSIPTDKGATAMNDAERSRFVRHIKGANSDAESARNWFVVNAIKKLWKLGVPNPEKLADWYGETVSTKSGNKIAANKNAKVDEYTMEDIESVIAIVDLATYLLDDARFDFDLEADLRQIYDTQANLSNQRSLTSGLYNADAVADDYRDMPQEFIDWVENDSAFLDKDKELLVEIVQDYMRLHKADFMDKIKQIIGVEVANNNNDAANATANTTANDEDEDEEDDEDLFSNSSKEQDMSAKEIEDLVGNVVSGWTF